MSFVVIKTNEGVFATGKLGMKNISEKIVEEYYRKKEEQEILKNILNVKSNNIEKIKKLNTFYVGKKNYKEVNKILNRL